MAKNADVDFSKLKAMFAELSSEAREKAIRLAYRKAANIIRDQAVRNAVRQMHFHDEDILKGIRSLVFREKIGFRVTDAWKYGSKSPRGGMWASDWQKDNNPDPRWMPILAWHEDGTQQRRTRGGLGKRTARLLGTGRRTGALKPKRFIGEAVDQKKDSINDELKKFIINDVRRITKKYGCK